MASSGHTPPRVVFVCEHGSVKSLVAMMYFNHRAQERGLKFRAIARGLAERVVVTTFPGTTAHTFASRASDVFPQFRSELSRSADTFDRVRYLGSAGTDADWQAVRTLEAGLRQSRPVLEPVPA